jgi:hypothetical protein
MRRPVPLAIGAVVVLLLLASPALTPDRITDITSSPTIDGVQAIAAVRQVAAGRRRTFQVAVTDYDNPATQLRWRSRPRRARSRPQRLTTPSKDGKVASSRHHAGAGQNDPAPAIVSQVRSTTVPAAFASLPASRRT